MSEPKLPSWMNYSDYEDIMHYLRLFGEMKPYYLKAEDVFNTEQEVMKRKMDDGLRLIDVAKEMIWNYKYKERWHQLPKDENMNLTEAKQELIEHGYILENTISFEQEAENIVYSYGTDEYGLDVDQIVKIMEDASKFKTQYEQIDFITNQFKKITGLTIWDIEEDEKLEAALFDMCNTVYKNTRK